PVSYNVHESPLARRNRSRGPSMRHPTAFLLAIVAATLASPPAHADGPPWPRLPALDPENAMLALPGGHQRYPIWARMLVEPLPRTTAAMLQLDYVHRAQNPLGAVLAAKLRWATADTLGCDYARQYAAADLRRAGLKDADLDRLAGK